MKNRYLLLTAAFFIMAVLFAGCSMEYSVKNDNMAVLVLARIPISVFLAGKCGLQSFPQFLSGSIPYSECPDWLSDIQVRDR